MNFNVRLPEELHYRFKVACTLERVEMSEVVRRFIEEYVSKEEKREQTRLPKKKS